MDNNSLCVNSASKVTTGAFIGLCAGTVVTPHRDSLKKLLVQRPDYFERTFNPTIIKRMNEEEIGALKIIQEGSKTFRTSGKSEDKKIQTAAKKWYKKYNSIKVAPALTQRLENKKEFLKNAINETGIIDIHKRLRNAGQKLLEAPDNLILRDEVLALSKQKKQLKSTLEFPINEYRNALADVKKDRMSRIKSLPNSGFEVKKYYKQMENAIAKKRTIQSNKLYELTNTPLLKDSYNKIKSFLPEYRIGNALKGAAAFGTLTALWLVFFNPSTRT